MKFIVLLRNPVEKVYSHYQFNLQQNKESLSFQEAFLAWSRIQELGDEAHIDVCHETCPLSYYVDRAKYAEQLPAWFEQFSRDQFLILQSEHFFKHTEEVMREVCHFLAIPYWEKTEYKITNSGKLKEKIDWASRQHLATYFNPYNEKLYALLGEDYGWQ